MVTLLKSGTIASFRYDNKLLQIRASNDKSYCNTDEIQVDLQFNEITDTSFEWMFWIKNSGIENSKQIIQIYGLDIKIPVADDDAVIWESLAGDSCGADSFLPVSENIRQYEAHFAEPSGGRSSNTTAFPYFDLQCGSMNLICAIGWSGQWTLNIYRDTLYVHVRVGIKDVDLYLKPGESVRSPRMFLMTSKKKIEDCRREFRLLQRKYFSPFTYLGEDFTLPIAMQTFDRYFGSMPEWSSEAGQIKCVQKAVECEFIDTYWLDAAWFKDRFPCGVGNYSFHYGFSNGLKYISDAVHKHGMKFMLWFEPERIYAGSEVFCDHPEWLLSVPYDENTKLFNLAEKDAREWLLQTLIKFIEDNGIDIYRQDFNIDPLDYWRLADEEKRKGYTEIKYIEGLYWLWDSLLTYFPKMLIDNCSSGGRRIDFETCNRSVPLWRSDTGCAPSTPDRHSDVWNQNQSMCLSRYLVYHSICSWSAAANEFRSAATMSIALDLNILDDYFNVAPVKKALSEMKDIREYWKGNFYELSDISKDENVWAAYQLHSKEKNAGFCVFFRREKTGKTFGSSILTLLILI